MKRILLFLLLLVNLHLVIRHDGLTLCSFTTAYAQHMTREAGDNCYLAEIGWYHSPLSDCGSPDVTETGTTFKYYCQFCNQDFGDSYDCMKHELACPKKTSMFQCSWCGLNFNTQNELENHQCSAIHEDDFLPRDGTTPRDECGNPIVNGGTNRSGGYPKNHLQQGKDHLKPWLNNCKSVCDSIIKTYNPDYDPDDYIYLPLCIYTDSISYHHLKRLPENFDEAWKNIIKMINKNHPVLAGVDEKDSHPGNFDLITDHFVVITGYGYHSNGNPYLKYAESAKSDISRQQSTQNILNWDGSAFTGNCHHNRNYQTYTLTQIRITK